MLSKSIIISIIATLTHALPSGSPYCQIDDSNRPSFESNHGKESASPVFEAQFTSGNGAYKINLSKKETPIHGVLLYVVGSDKNKHLGQFTQKTGFKFVTDCTGGSGSTLTHENSGAKQDTEFIWTPGPNDSGPFTLHAVVTGDKMPWQILTVNADQGNGSAQTGGPVAKDDPFAELPNFGNIKVEAPATASATEPQPPVSEIPEPETETEETFVTGGPVLEIPEPETEETYVTGGPVLEIPEPETEETFEPQPPVSEIPETETEETFVTGGPVLEIPEPETEETFEPQPPVSEIPEPETETEETFPIGSLEPESETTAAYSSESETTEASGSEPTDRNISFSGVESHPPAIFFYSLSALVLAGFLV